MPTPESEYFLSRKPKVPPTFDGVDLDDNRAVNAAQDAIIREQWVQNMMARLVRDELGKWYDIPHVDELTSDILTSSSYWTHGVNHLEKCGALRERYLELLKTSKVKGYLFQQQNYVTKPE